MAPRNNTSLAEYGNLVRKWNIDAGHFDPENFVEDWVGDDEARDLAVTLVEEEVEEMGQAVSELRNAVDRDVMDPDDPWIEAEILDASADIMFTLLGLLTKAGLIDYLPDTMDEVIRSNETKLIEPVVLPNGKIGKNPLYYEEPDIKTILLRR